MRWRGKGVHVATSDTMEGVDEATATLIASLMAEDDPYKTEEEEGADPGDVEWDLVMESRKSLRKDRARRC